MSNSPEDSRDHVRRIWRPEGDQVSRVNERPRDPLRVGREVTVQRSNGQLEPGWKIVGFENDGHTAVVQLSTNNDEVLEKKISTLELETLNPPNT